MPRLQEITAEDDSLDSCSPAKDEEGTAPRQLPTFKKTEYDSLHLSPGKSVLKVLWERVSAEIAQRSGHTVQAGVKGSLSVKKAWSPPTTHYEEHPIPQQQLSPPDEKASAEAAWERVTQAVWERVNTDLNNVADTQEGLPTLETARNEPEQQLTESDHETAPSLANRGTGQVIWNRGSTAADRKNVANVQDNISCTASKEEEGELESEKEGANLSSQKSNSERMRQLEEDIISTEKPQSQGTEDRISSKTQDSTSELAPKGEQEDQDSVEEKVTTYDAPVKEKMEDHVCLAADPKRLVKKLAPSLETQETDCHLNDYLEERIVYRQEAEKNQYPAFMMDSQQTALLREKIQEDVKPQHMLHEDVPRSQTVELLSCTTDAETKREGSEVVELGEAGEEEVPYLSYNPPEPVQKAHLIELDSDNQEVPETTRDKRIEELRRELEAVEGYDEEDDTCLFDEEALSLRPQAADGRTYIMPDPVRARLDEEVLLYHVPRSPEAPRRFSDKVFFRFK